MGLKIKSFEIALPFGIGKMSVLRTEAQLKAAWSLYVEYATRISTQPLESGQGSIREALNSLHKLFEVTRAVLKQEGPAVAEGPNSVGPVAIRILNEGLRPFIVKWHTKLSAFEIEQKREQRKTPGAVMEAVIDESQWEEAGNFYKALETFRKDFLEYVETLEILAGLKQE
ncbi:MAG: hypothetical protein GY859_23575 [Desulfobacterales bacterium]|nr:hypothetical protein [Desulfobacterales bacterium]